MAYAAASSQPSATDILNQSQHKTSTTPSIGKINDGAAPAPQSELASKYTAAANAKPLIGGGSNATSFLNQVAGTVSDQPVSAGTVPSSTKPTFTPHELVNERTATSTAHLNKDGTITKTRYFAPHFYKNNGSWQPIDSTLVTDDNAADSGNIFGQALGAVESWVSTPNAYKTQANSWEARFTPSDFSSGMVRIEQGSSQVGFSPVNANSVNPVITKNSAGQQVVHYSNLWNGVDVEYTVESDQVKEAVIINDKQAASQVQFKVIGADLQQPSTASTPTDPQPAFTITGALGNQFSVTPANLILNHYGFVDPAKSGLTQRYSGGTLTVGVNSSYLQNLPANAFPAVIDPTVESSFGVRGEGNFLSFEQGGPTCYSNTCVLSAGDGYDANNVWQSWHGALFAPYNIFQNSGVTMTDAALTLSQESGGTWWTGNYSTWNFQVTNASCLTGYSCTGSTSDNGAVTSSPSTIDVTNIYNSFIGSGNWGGWLMLAADDGAGNASFKAFDPDNSYVTFTYATKLTPPTIVTPQSGQVFTDPQASFSAALESNPNDSTSLEYQFQVTDDADGTGSVVNSGGWLNSVAGTGDAANWTVPDGVLQNGNTYYVEAQSYDPSTGYTSPWSAPVPFRIDLREGADSTQTYDTVGPIKVDLATGNVETSTASHTTAALGGSLGVDLDYNSPIKSSPGLVASYWNLPNGGSGIPTTAPNLQRVDQNVNFNWNSGSPGAGINSTYFAAQWNGYFVAPTTGSYNFGGFHGQSLSITVNGTQVYSNSGCSSGPCFGTPIYLTGGQVVPFQASYNHSTGYDYAQIYVSGAVPQQPIPGSMFQTGVRELQQYGLTGQYFTYTDTGSPPSFPSDGTDGLFLTRTDPLINFNWSGTVPVTNSPQADWMAKWTGYLTVPATGSYVFGANSDDGSTITVNGTQVYSHWQDGSNTGYGTAISLTAGQSVPITVTYYQHTGNDTMSLLVEPLGGASEVVPSNWLTPYKPVVPAGWNLGFDPSGSVSYTHLTANTNTAVLTDSTGDTYDYTWNGTGYSPPVGSSGFLDRNNDGSYTLQDSDGTTYVFSQAGDLASVTKPTDTQGDASLSYTYGAVNGNGPDAIQQITDGVNANRWAKVYYGGASQCGTPPSGFGTTPTNMLCALQTNDGRTTYFYYDTNGNLAEVAKPGNDDTSYQYQAVLNAASSTIGYQLTGIRSDLANDAVIAGERTNDSSTYTQLQYDALGRVTSVAEPAATAGASPLTKTFSYNTPYWQSPANTALTLASGASPVTVSPEPNVVFMIARGASNNMVASEWTPSTGWSAWNNLGQCMIGDPSVASKSPGTMDVLYEGCNSTGVNLWWYTWNSSSGWESASNAMQVGSAKVTSAPTITSRASGLLDVFAATGSTLYQTWYNSSGWSAGQNLGGCITGAPDATAWGSSNTDVFAQHCTGTGNNLDQITFNGTSWGSWATDPLHIANTPSSTSLGTGELDVVSTNASNQVEQATYTSNGGWTGWNQLDLCTPYRPSLSFRSSGPYGYNTEDLFAQSCQSGSSGVLWQTLSPGLNTTIEHVTGATEPMGYSELVQYDYQDRTTAVYNNLGQATTTQWDPVQDLQYSSTNPEGLMSTNVYNDLNQLVSQYGPAPAGDYNTWSSTLANGQSLTEGQSLKSPDGRFVLTFQTNGDVVLSGPSGTLWQSNTTGDAATAFTMQTDGNLVLYNGSTQLATTGTSGAGPSTYFVVQNDGNAVMYNAYGPVWSTGTGGQSPAAGGESSSGYDTPLSGYTSQVARTDTAYDSGTTGLSVNYFAVSEPSANDATLTGAPLLHTTNIASDGTIYHDWGSTSPISISGDWGLSMTGTMRLPATGTWYFEVNTKDIGVRMWVDNQLIIDRWNDDPNGVGIINEGSYNNTVADSVHSVRIDYYHQSPNPDAVLSVQMESPNGGGWMGQVAQYFSPNYGLQTGTTGYDSSVGNATVTTAYGSDPGQGQVASTTVNPTGLNLTTSDTYQTPGSAYGMLTSTTAPGGAATSYSYYGANDTAVNPCVNGSTAAYQAGMLKTLTEPSGETVTQVYDDSGNIVATQTNSDGWECKTYDARGRLTQDVIPAFNGSLSRTITYNYDVGGNPLVGSETDSQGTITTTIDLLGRTVSYTDVYGDTTTMTYDNLGRVSGDSGPLGTEAYTYNSYNQLTNQTLGGTSLAQPGYDQYGRLSTVTYPTAGVTETIGYDPSYGFVSSNSYTLPSSEVITDSDTHSQSGKILTDTTAFGSSSSTWSYTYDLADRLTAASSTGAIGSNSYGYSYGAESGSCPTGTNMSAGMDGNRTSQTINGATTTYCYNPADQLTASSNAAVANAVYDSHGNTTSLGSTGNVTSFAYDASDRNTSITQGSQSTSYVRDVADDIVSRTVSTGSGSTTTNYGFTGTGASFAMNSSDTIVEDYPSLPGGLSLTIRPGQTGAASQTASLSNIHGNTIATLDGTNTLNGTFTYDPFGNLISTGGQPANTTNSAAFGWAGAAGKFTETALALNPIQMGARVYIPSIGRFTSEDPAPGSLPNLYTYPLDPINESDLSGASACEILCVSLPSSQGVALQSTIAAAVVVQAAASSIDIRIGETQRRASAKATPAAPAPKSQPVNPPTSQAVQMSQIAEKPINLEGLQPESPLATAPTGNPQVFDLPGALGSAGDYSDFGEKVGGIGGCYVGRAVGFLAGLREGDAEAGAFEGCAGGVAAGSVIGKSIGYGIGFLIGGFDLPGSDALSQ